MKTTKTYSIEESIYKAFDSLTTERNINKSSFIEDSIKKFLKDNNMDFIDKIYSLKDNPNHMVTVVSQDQTYYFLDDGSKIQKILFMQIFKESETIKPDEFFSKSAPILENIVEKIKKIDESKVNDYPHIPGTLDKINKFKGQTDEGIYYVESDSELLNEINTIYKTKEYLNMSKLEICEIIIKLNKMKFGLFSTTEYKLQRLLIDIFTDLKDLAIV